MILSFTAVEIADVRRPLYPAECSFGILAGLIVFRGAGKDLEGAGGVGQLEKGTWTSQQLWRRLAQSRWLVRECVLDSLWGAEENVYTRCGPMSLTALLISRSRVLFEMFFTNPLSCFRAKVQHQEYSLPRNHFSWSQQESCLLRLIYLTSVVPWPQKYGMTQLFV